MMAQLPLFHPPKTREALSNDIWRACDILRRDNNCGGIMEYVEHRDTITARGSQESRRSAVSSTHQHPLVSKYIINIILT